jgi:hypothetical protein
LATSEWLIQRLFLLMGNGDRVAYFTDPMRLMNKGGVVPLQLLAAVSSPAARAWPLLPRCAPPRLRPRDLDQCGPQAEGVARGQTV